MPGSDQAALGRKGWQRAIGNIAADARAAVSVLDALDGDRLQALDDKGASQELLGSKLIALVASVRQTLPLLPSGSLSTTLKQEEKASQGVQDAHKRWVNVRARSLQGGDGADADELETEEERASLDLRDALTALLAVVQAATRPPGPAEEERPAANRSKSDKSPVAPVLPRQSSSQQLLANVDARAIRPADLLQSHQSKQQQQQQRPRQRQEQQLQRGQQEHSVQSIEAPRDAERDANAPANITPPSTPAETPVKASGRQLASSTESTGSISLDSLVGRAADIDVSKDLERLMSAETNAETDLTNNSTPEQAFCSLLEAEIAVVRQQNEAMDRLIRVDANRQKQSNARVEKLEARIAELTRARHDTLAAIEREKKRTENALRVLERAGLAHTDDEQLASLLPKRRVQSRAAEMQKDARANARRYSSGSYSPDQVGLRKLRHPQGESDSSSADVGSPNSAKSRRRKTHSTNKI